MNITPDFLASMLDSTNLRLDATHRDIEDLCLEAAQNHFACVMIYPTSIPLASRMLSGTDTSIGTVIGFPSGRFSTVAKAAEIRAAEAAGAKEVDVVINYDALRTGETTSVSGEVHSLATLAHTLDLVIKIIVETCYLPRECLLPALKICEDAGVDFIKTSTGFGSAGAQPEHISLWAANRRTKIGLKAAGGIKTLAVATALIEAGATRLGTSNASGLLAELRGLTQVAAGRGGY